MKLTCVTAVFNAIASGNRERLIRCVESVSKLKIEHEHLIYDGGSNDGTVELLKELEVRVVGMRWRSEPDLGIYNALNKGVRDAQGEWLLVLGCDDYIGYVRVLDGLLSHVSPETQVCVSPVQKEYASGIRDIGFVRKNLFFGMPYCHQGVLIRTDVARALGGFDERYHISADYDMILKCHIKALNIRFYKERYAVFSDFGVSGQSHGKFGESIDIMREQFGLTRLQAEHFKETLALPLRVVLPYFFHRDVTLRWVTFYMVARWGLWMLKRLRLT